MYVFDAEARMILDEVNRLSNANNEVLRVSGSLHVSTRHRIPDKRGARFTQVWGPWRGNTLTSCPSDLDYG
jgi:hypothetical protein